MTPPPRAEPAPSWRRISARLVGAAALLTGLATTGRVMGSGLCPAGSTEVATGECVRDTTEIDLEGTNVNGVAEGPGMQLVMEASLPRFPCDELREPGTLDAWELCLLNYYGSTEIAELSYTIASRFVESGTCPDDATDIETLREIVEHYARNPKQEDLGELQVTPLDPRSSASEPHLPVMCGYSVSQRKWYRPRSFYCAGQECFPQAAHGAKNRVRYVPLGALPNLMKVVGDDPEVQSVGNGGSYGYLRVIPLGNDVFLASAGGMYGNAFFYGLVIVPSEEQYLRRACDRELTAKNPATRRGRRPRLLAAAGQLVGQASALLELRRTATLLADPTRAFTEAQRELLRIQAEDLASVLQGTRPAAPQNETGCVRYQARYPRPYQQALPRLGKVP